MKWIRTYHVVCFFLFAQLLASCTRGVNKTVTLWRNDKIPYGTYYAYNSLQYLFDDAVIETSNTSPVNFYRDGDSSGAYIILTYEVSPNDNELNAILNYAMSGNHVFISAARLSESLLDSFKLKASSRFNFFSHDDTFSVKLENIDNGSTSFEYPGYNISNYFTAMDSTVTQVLGYDDEGRANFVKLRYQGGGAVYLHLAPAAFTNFFLLHKNNKHYYDLALSTIPDTVELIRWDDYFRHHSNGNNKSEKSAFSKLGAFLNNEVLRWAFWLTILLFAIVYLVESKRKQRVIPTVKKLNNSSLDFVKTVGRLYYQRKDNKNLAQKIAANFLGQVRNRFNLSTSQLNEAFEERLVYKSGQPAATVKEILDEIRALELMYDMSDEELLAFSDKIDKFINKV